MNFYKAFIRPLLFLLSPETSHKIAVGLLQVSGKVPLWRLLLRKLYCVNNPALERNVAGIRFPNPVGLAAGFDKNALFFDEMEMLGFGFVEVGTVTPLAQPGNDKPRLFRLPADEALINRMGFNNDGAEQIAARLKSRKHRVLVGGNIGKNKITPNNLAGEDYEKCFRALFDYVDFFVVNVSSPNTPGLRSLQEKEPLKAILNRLQQINDSYASRKPIFLKIAPELSDEQLNDVIELVSVCRIDAVVATNTTISRSGLKTGNVNSFGEGGLSGKPLAQRSTEVVRYLYERSKGAFPIIASGGIHGAADAMEKFKAGATLVELYTGFIYEGPVLAKKIMKMLLQEKKKSEA
ncbi:MAG: quinone-dependent dihydroorotate dehydrogenase [Bacteroidia bacterium]|jgi:dihydroorotate dehydrogenase|nr:quinone-dependent dihydroorotate dehydrogenase [Bacteroidia bacterium]